jgi:hypothetical protein
MYQGGHGLFRQDEFMVIQGRCIIACYAVLIAL